jgi:hypothetical protein
MEKRGDAAGAGVVPGHRDKCALTERERRFLLARPPRGGAARRDIIDHYLTGTRLRLRRVTGGGRAEPEYKLTSDDRFTGGRLAVARRAELLAWLAEYGVDAAAGS